MLFREIYFCSMKLLLSSENGSWTNEKICLEILVYFVSASSYCSVTDHWHFKIKCIATFLISYLITSIFVWVNCKAMYILKYYIFHMKTVLNTFQRLRRKVFLQFCCISYILSIFVKTHFHEEKLHQCTWCIFWIDYLWMLLSFPERHVQNAVKIKQSLYISNTSKTKNVQ